MELLPAGRSEGLSQRTGFQAVASDTQQGKLLSQLLDLQRPVLSLSGVLACRKGEARLQLLVLHLLAAVVVAKDGQLESALPQQVRALVEQRVLLPPDPGELLAFVEVDGARGLRLV